jgi:hypothetical protein
VASRVGAQRAHGSLRRAARRAAILLLLLCMAACNYTLQAGGGLPEGIRTVFIETFENQTDNFELQSQLNSALTQELPRALGLRLAGETAADAVVRGRITRYNDAAQAYRPGETGTIDVQQHQVEITVAIEVVDVRNNVILWDSQGLIGRGQYRPDSQQPRAAYLQAIESLRQQIIDGMQSQW